MRKLIGASVLGVSPVFFLDNVKGHLSSASLEALTTTPFTEFRYLGRSEMHQAEHGLTVFITGNRATFSPDMRRRTLMADLFVEEVRPESRVIANPLDDVRLVEMRSEILAALWALVRNWQNKGCPAPRQINQTFRPWSKIVGGILEAAGFQSPTAQASAGGASGDTDLTEMEALVANMNEGRRYDFANLVELARHHHLFERILGDAPQEGEKDRTSRSTFGKVIRDRFTDRIFANNGHPVRFILASKTARKSYAIIPAQPGREKTQNMPFQAEIEEAALL
jgi:hypothetical protein